MIVKGKLFEKGKDFRQGKEVRQGKVLVVIRCASLELASLESG